VYKTNKNDVLSQNLLAVFEITEEKLLELTIMSKFTANTKVLSTNSDSTMRVTVQDTRNPQTAQTINQMRYQITKHSLYSLNKTVNAHMPANQHFDTLANQTHHVHNYRPPVVVKLARN